MDVTSFDFEHKVFAIPGAYIAGSGAERQAVLHVRMGELNATLPVDGLVREFDIAPESVDFKLIALARNALKYVPHISPGDKIPTEVLDGRASWPIRPEHVLAARSRLMLNLAEWESGEAMTSSKTRDLAALLETPEVKKHIQRGFDNAMAKLELKDREAVVSRTETLARELSYIYALKDYYNWIFGLRRRIGDAQNTLKGDKQALESSIRASHLTVDALKQYKEKFDRIDAMVHDVVTALDDLDDVVVIIRRVRDELHTGTLVWAELEPTWKTPNFRSRDETRKAVAELYTFVAQRFLKTG